MIDSARASDLDTIAAIATAVGPAGVGIVRVSGPRAIEIVARALAIEPPQLDRTVRVGWVRDAAGNRVDQVIAFAMRGPRSFTGEDVAEVQGHGGAMNLERLLAVMLEGGARVAEAGEFTRRALANNKLDILRAEALLEVIHAGSERAWRLAQHNLAGELAEHVAAIEQRALQVLAEVEGWIDFPEEDLEAKSRQWIESELAGLVKQTHSLVEGFMLGRALTHGITVALVGAVNVGKSSLLNRLVGSERALVAAQPGTTRDWIEARTQWSGIVVTVVDTAGQRATEDMIERRGIELGEQRIANADVVVVVNDGIAQWTDGKRFGERALLVLNKSDLQNTTTETVLRTSAKTGEGIEELKKTVLAKAGIADREGSEDGVVTTARQREVLAAAHRGFDAALRGWRAKWPLEVVAVEVRQGAHALARLRGVEVGERVLDELFARFCIGK